MVKLTYFFNSFKIQKSKKYTFSHKISYWDIFVHILEITYKID